MKKIITTITAILLFGNLNAQMVNETDQELMIDCFMLKENIEYQLQQYEVNVDLIIEIRNLTTYRDPVLIRQYNDQANFHSLKAEQFSVIYSAICK